MLRHRVIPILLHDSSGLVKTKQFDLKTYIGDPINAIRIFSDKFVDELIFLDIARSQLGRDPDFELIERISAEAFMPLSYGGGISTITSAKKIFGFGLDKVILQSATFVNPSLVNEIVDFAGSQSLAISIDLIRDKNGHLKIWHSSSKRQLDISLGAYLDDMQKRGAGEILISSVQNEGTMNGFDLNMINEIRKYVSVPLVANGGAGQMQDFAAALSAGADAVAAGSFFVFYGKRRAVLLSYPDYNDLKEFIHEL